MIWAKHRRFERAVERVVWGIAISVGACTFLYFTVIKGWYMPWDIPGALILAGSALGLTLLLAGALTIPVFAFHEWLRRAPRS